MNTKPDAKVMSWWDYGYQIAAMANRSTLVDNNTWNNTHIAMVGTAMASREEHSIKIIRAMDVDYVLVIFGGLTGYASDDINKVWRPTVFVVRLPLIFFESILLINCLFRSL